MATQKEIAQHLDISDRQVRKLLSSSVLPASKGTGGYNLDGCRIAYISYLRNLSKHKSTEQETPPDSIDLDQERARLVKAQADAQELKNEILEGRSIPTDFGREVISKVLVQVGGILNALPLNIKRKHPELEKRVIDSIQLEIVKHSNEAAKLDEYIDQAIDDVIEQSEGKI